MHFSPSQAAGIPTFSEQDKKVDLLGKQKYFLGIKKKLLRRLLDGDPTNIKAWKIICLFSILNCMGNIF